MAEGFPARQTPLVKKGSMELCRVWILDFLSVKFRLDDWLDSAIQLDFGVFAGFQQTIPTAVWNLPNSNLYQ